MIKEKSKIIKAIAVDINPDSCCFSAEFFKLIGVDCKVLQFDFLNPLPELKGLIDVLIFNPPYVSTEKNELQIESIPGENKNYIQLAWAGGNQGTSVTLPALREFISLLSNKGVIYLILIDDNDPVSFLRNFDVQWELLSREKYSNEIINVFRLSKFF